MDDSLTRSAAGGFFIGAYMGKFKIVCDAVAAHPELAAVVLLVQTAVIVIHLASSLLSRIF